MHKRKILILGNINVFDVVIITSQQWQRKDENGGGDHRSQLT
jgi:hypothetical protein